jgi:propanol-preferring alcohol dehydrogenase
MKGALLRDYNTPLKVVDLAIGAPGPAEVLIDVRACGLCHTDQAIWTGDIPWPVPSAAPTSTA